MDGEREELLRQRVVDRDDAPSDWDELGRLAAADAGLWDRLLLGLRDDASLRAATGPLLALADRVEAPVRMAASPRGGRSWLPWTLAAGLAIGWTLQVVAGRTPDAHPGGSGPASIVLGELPRLMVHATPTDDGSGLRVVSLRRVLEQTVVAKAARLGVDEVGTTHTVAVDLVSLATPTDY